jgi:flagellum-specific ATP synthase
VTPSTMRHLARYFAGVERGQSWCWQGHVLESLGQTIESAGPVASVGECCVIRDRQQQTHLAEVIGFRGNHLLSMPIDTSEGVRFGDTVSALGVRPEIAVGPSLMGRVLNGLGEPIDEGGPLATSENQPLDGRLRSPMDRTSIRSALGTGIRAVDTLLTVGRGQRVGIFGGSGVGKSTLIGMMTRNTEADVTVVGLVGERGREVGEFLEESLGREGRARSVVVVSTSDQSPLLRLRAALAATTIAESFAAEGKDVLLVLDSLTRFAMAAREIGLAAGEPPTNKGYTPSVFTRLARLIERAGQFRVGSITAFYTVLMEGDDQQDPLVDAVRALLDGHIVLSRALAAEGWYPPVEILDSISRLMPAVSLPDHREHAALLRRLMAVYARSEDLVRIGAYKPGADPELDRAIHARESLRTFLTQSTDQRPHLADSVSQLAELAGEI